MDAAKAEIDRLTRELVAAQQEGSQSAAYGLELLNEKENLQQRFDELKTTYQQTLIKLSELQEALNKAVSEQRVSATTVFEKEVQLLNDSDALQHSFSIAKQEIEKELKQTKVRLESALEDKERYSNERDELIQKISSIEQDRKALKDELKDLKSREARLFNENNELEEENVNLQKQVSTFIITLQDFETSKHRIQCLEDEVAELKIKLEDEKNLQRKFERERDQALKGLDCEREQKETYMKELEKLNSVDPSSSNNKSLFDEVHLTEIRKLILETDNLNGDDVESLKAMLYKKHEQVKQLRTILKSNQESAEVALKNLKSKYDIEKAIVIETMTKLRQDHKKLSEDAKTFASIRTHFSSRIEEYNAEIENLQSKLAASEHEKNTLNSLLRTAIEQKIALTQKLEAVEMNRIHQ